MKIESELGLGISHPWVLLTQMVFVVVGIQVVAGMSSIPSVGWMFMYHPDDFKESSWREILSFLWHLRTGIPPVLAGMELICVKITGSASLITVDLYQLAMVGSYLLAMLLARSSGWQYGLSVLVSGVFLYSTALIHPGVPVSYDVFFPALFLLFLNLLKLTRVTENTCVATLAPVAAGFFLSMVELSRPFVIYSLPLLLFASLRLLPERRSAWYGFLAPVVLISGFWHLHLYSDYGQVSFTNHSGMNLARGWPQVRYSPPIPEDMNHKKFPDRWFDRNTETHALNSQRLQREVFGYWIENPVKTIKHIFYRMGMLLSARTDLYSHEPKSWALRLYVPMVWLTACLLALRFLASIKELLQGHRFDWNRDGSDLVLAGFTIFSLVILAIGEAGEEARLLISVLPFLAVCTYPRWSFERFKLERGIAVNP